MTMLAIINRIRGIIDLVAITATVPVIVNFIIPAADYNAFAFYKSPGYVFAGFVV